jgi:signal transduction histidine kinase
VSVRAEGDAWPLPPDVQIALYRIAQEALNNTAKHAGAKQAEVLLRWRPDGVDLRLSDNGRGYLSSGVQPRGDGQRSAGRLGLGIMHERAHSIAARLRIHSQPGIGTSVRVRWRRA